MATELDESKAVTTAIRGQDPIFDVKLALTDTKTISENQVELQELQDFKLYP